MAIPTVSLNESSPTTEDYQREGPARIQEYKLQNREILEVDHDYPSSGSSDTAGYHKKISLEEQTDIGSGTEAVCFLGAQTTDDRPELVFTDEDDNDVQITKDGYVNLDAVALTAMATLLGFIYPVGSIYCNFSDSTNPATLFGFGTWVSMQGYTLVGVDSGTFATPGVEVGSETSTTSNHSHTVPISGWGESGTADVGYLVTHTDGVLRKATTAVSTSSAGSEAISIIQPSMPVYMWRRTA